MAGGLFGEPFAFNMKCIVFSIMCMSLFLYKPEFKNNYTLSFSLFIIFVAAYVIMAWYDHFYNCDIAPFKRGKYSLTGTLKPKETEECDTTEDVSARKMTIYLSHILFIVPLLVYIVVKKDKVNKNVYPILGVLALFTAGYHGTKIMLGSHNNVPN